MQLGRHWAPPDRKLQPGRLSTKGEGPSANPLASKSMHNVTCTTHAYHFNPKGLYAESACSRPLAVGDWEQACSLGQVQEDVHYCLLARHSCGKHWGPADLEEFEVAQYPAVPGFQDMQLLVQREVGLHDDLQAQ